MYAAIYIVQGDALGDKSIQYQTQGIHTAGHSHQEATWQVMATFDNSFALGLLTN